jgi:hypothetical protein
VRISLNPPSTIEDTMAAITDKPYSSNMPGQSTGETGQTRQDMPAAQSTVSATPPMGQPHSDSFERVVQGAHHTIDKLAATAAPHVQRLQEGVVAAGETLQSRAHQAREVGDEWADSLRNTVRENPLAAVLSALAVGVLIARLTR